MLPQSTDIHMMAMVFLLVIFSFDICSVHKHTVTKMSQAHDSCVLGKQAPNSKEEVTITVLTHQTALPLTRQWVI